MQKETTLNQLVSLLYRETATLETLEWENRLEEDQPLKEAFNDLKAAFHQLPKVKFDVNPSTLQKILGYSRSTAVEPSL